MEYINLDFTDWHECLATQELWQKRGFDTQLFELPGGGHRVRLRRIAVDTYNALQQGVRVVESFVNLEDDRLAKSHLGG